MKQTQWMLYVKKADFYSLGAQFNISPVLARIMINRGVKPEEFGKYLHGTLRDLHDPLLMKDMEEAAGAIIKAAGEHRRFRVVGDYDIDGVCSTYLLVRMLQQLGADVSYDIPDRVLDGYGINEMIINRAHEDGIDVILTCDNGISAMDALKLAREYGMNVIVTDHHEVPKDESGRDMLPPADYVIDPHRADCAYPFKSICGGVVAWKLMQTVYDMLGLPHTEWEKYTDFAAFASVGDVMPITDENRIITKQGLAMIDHTENRGLAGLIKAVGLNGRPITAYALGFVLGPCINACGRLESAKTAMRLLLSEDETEIMEISEHLRELNDMRKELTARYTQEACASVDADYAEDDVKVLFLDGCHESIAGIIAGRVKEYCNHPVIVFTKSTPGYLKGSGRSIEAYNIFEKLSRQKELLVKFGGHPMAAGLTIREEDLENVRRALNGDSGLSEDDFTEKIMIDVALPFSYATQEFVREMEILEPFAGGNARPVFAQKNVRILGARVLGRLHNVVKLKLRDEAGTIADAVMFTDADAWMDEMRGVQMMDVLYYPQINEYNGEVSVQLVVKDVRRSRSE
jgi:single-stranded-DNA-specific exonuclease